MKNSIKFTLAALTLFSFTSLHSSAQVRLSAGVDGGLPVGSLKDSYDWNLGGSIQADLPLIKDQLYLTVNGGYNNFFAKNDFTQDDLQMIPVKGGFKFFPVKLIYIQGEAGASFVVNQNKSGLDKNAVFVYAPQAGILLPIGAGNFIDAGIRYESNAKFYDHGKTNNFLSLRIAYAFNL